MFGVLLKKRLSDNKLANIFVNGLFDSIDNGFPIVAELINDDPVFVVSPEISPRASYDFSVIMLVGNISFLESSFDPDQADRIENLVFAKLAGVYDMELAEFKSMIRDYKNFMVRLNSPSKNMVYAMSKAIFDKYGLYNYQDEYFKRMMVPNPLFLKRMDEVVSNFIWDWDAFFKRYKLS